jgi:hypothetical protein
MKKVSCWENCCKIVKEMGDKIKITLRTQIFKWELNGTGSRLSPVVGFWYEGVATVAVT